MRQRVPLILSMTALIIAVLGATPFGRAAGDAVSAVVPFAKSANYAKLAGNSSKLNGRKSTVKGAPGTIPVVGKDGKLPASLGAVGPQGPAGTLNTSQFYSKSQIDTMLKALTGANVVDGSLRLGDLGGPDGNERTTPVNTAFSIPAGVCVNRTLTLFNPAVGPSGASVIGDMVIGTLGDANGNAVLPNTGAVVPSIVIKTSQGGALANLIVCNSGNSAQTVPVGSVFRWRLIGT
jgi:hypothetical protein